jgi:UDP-glucose 4-epimerase
VNVVLIGGTGYVGGRLASYLKAQGHRVSVTTRRPRKDVPEWLPADEIVHADLEDASAIRRAVAGKDAVVHLAAPDEIEAARDPLGAIHAGGPRIWKFAEELAECDPRPILIYLSTFHVYGENARGEVSETTVPVPSHPYGLGRYVGECVVRSFRAQNKVDALCVRMSNAFGAPLHEDTTRWSLVFNDLCLQAVLDKKLVLKTRGEQKRNFITLTDAVRAIEFLLSRRGEWPADGVLHLGSSMNLSIREAADRVARAAKNVLGYNVPVTVPDGRDGSASELNFSVKRLTEMGFVWLDPADQEVAATLELCRQAEKKWGAALRRRCRPDLS